MIKILVAALSALLSAGPAFADEDLRQASAKVETSVHSILSSLKNKELSTAEKKDRVMKVVEPLFDLELIAKLVLGRTHWSAFTKDERKTFTDLFITQLQDSYFEKVDLLTDEKVEFGKPSWVDKKIQVPTYLLSKGERYEIIYKLTSRKGGWMVYDMEIEGISIVKSYGSQYDQFLRKKSPKELIVKMREKNLAPPTAFEEKKKEKVAEEPKEDEKAAEEPKADEKAAEEPKADEKAAEEPKADEEAAEEPVQEENEEKKEEG